MKHKINLRFVFYILFSLPLGKGCQPDRVILAGGWALTPDALLDSAAASYSKGDFESASRYYENILSLGYQAPQVYFNLGNCYYKLNEIGKSVLNYERAKKNSPFDEDINFNLKQVNQRTIDKIEPAPKLFLEQWWEQIRNMHSEKTWALRSIICFVLLFFFSGVFFIANNMLSKQFGFWLALIFFLLSAFSFFIAKSQREELLGKDAAVILSSSAEIKNSPSLSGTKLFVLHEGTKVSVVETNGDLPTEASAQAGWVKIKLSSEKVGWVKKTSIEFI